MFISLTQNKVALVDREDYEKLSIRKWCAAKNKSGTYYAMCSLDNKSVMMHRLLMNFPKKMEVDHINGNGLDNRKRNLRICTRKQNARNLKKSNGKCKYKGVTLRSGSFVDGKFYKNKKYSATIQKNGKFFHIGSFSTELEAALAYDKKANKFYGEFARTNF